jgi:hypothetical protein
VRPQLDGLGLPSCEAAQISTPAAYEGMCGCGLGPLGGGTAYNVVNAGHILHMPGYDARLLATRLMPLRVSNPQVWPGRPWIYAVLAAYVIGALLDPQAQRSAVPTGLLCMAVG